MSRRASGWGGARSRSSWTGAAPIAAGVSLFALARRMGTSLEMIDQTYDRLAPDADDYELGLLDAFDARVSSSDGHFSDTAD